MGPCVCCCAKTGSASVAARGELGNGELPDAARIGRRLARAYAKRGVALIEEEP